jgi:hypothetical protein
MRVLLLSVGVAIACASTRGAPPEAPDPSGQSYPAALELFCDVDRLSGADPNDPLERARQREDYLLEHIKNADGIYLLTVFRTRDSTGQAQLLEQATREHKITACPLLAAL